MKKILIGIMLLSAFVNSSISFSCFEPTKPMCIDSIEGNEIFKSSNDFDFCKMQVDSYLQDLNTYTQCVINEAQNEYNKAINIFNCKASGKKDCVFLNY